FVRTYFAYQRLGDPFAALTRRQPDLFRGGHVLDVGANIGYTASVFARALAPGFKVFAFEPERQNFERLVRTMRRRGLADRVEAVHAAVGASEGTVGLWRDVRHHAGHRITTDAFRAGRGVAPSDTVPLLSRVRGFVIHVLHEDGGLEAFDARRPERHLAGRLYVDLLCARQRSAS